MHADAKPQIKKGMQAIYLRLDDKDADWLKGEAIRQRRTIKQVVIQLLEDARKGQTFKQAKDMSEEELDELHSRPKWSGAERCDASDAE